MTTWLQFLARNGAKTNDGALLSVADVHDEPTPLTNFVAPLTDLGLIAFTGEEAAHFLHNQLTNDVEHLTQNDARLAGYCSPKGRLLATFLMWRTADTIFLELPRALQAAIQKRLQMFVMRAKAKLLDVTESNVILGLVGPKVATALAGAFPVLPTSPYAKVESPAGTLIRVADALDAPRYQWITTDAIASELWPTLAQALQPADADTWRLSEIHAGVPHITAATQEQFVPQMINYELIGGVNFKKGCYPGQEIVARSQYLGKLKRRMMLATVPAGDVQPGQEVYAAVDPDQPCGMIVNAERLSATEFACLVEVKVAAVDAGTIHVGSAGGAALQFQPLPYALTDPA